MARENQGLQVALIVFVMLTILLGVTTYMFWSQSQRLAESAEKASKDATEQRTLASRKQDELNQLKLLIGVDESEEVEKIIDLHREDMKQYGSGLAVEAQKYRLAIKELHDSLVNKSAELQKLQADLAALDAKFKQREAGSAAQVAKFDQDAKQAEAARQAVEADANKARADALKAAEDLQKRLEEARKESADLKSKSEAEVKKMQSRLEEVVRQNERNSETLAKLRRETFDVPSGEIRWVDQRTGTAWINLGRADGLPLQLTFAVYSGDATQVTRAAKKGSIEVVKIEGDHLAQARVIEHNPSDPLMPGDKIHTPLWSPGERKHFAIAGFIDIDGDGRSDRQMLKDIIRLNGGVIDCETDEKGEMIGQMTINTRYLVLGEQPTEKTAAGLTDVYSKMIARADSLGIAKITVPQLLEQMGWKSPTQVTRYGVTGRVSGAAGATAVEQQGEEKPAFRPRTPPKPGPGGAF